MTISMTAAKMPLVSRSRPTFRGFRGTEGRGHAAPEGSVPLTSLPNLLTLSRILAIPVVIATFYVEGDWRAGSAARCSRRRH